MNVNERGKEGRNQMVQNHLKQSQNPSILQTLASSHINPFIWKFRRWNHSIHPYLHYQYQQPCIKSLPQPIEHTRSGMKEFIWGLVADSWTGRARSPMGRAQPNESRPLWFHTAGVRWTGRAPPNRSRTSLDGSRTCKLPETVAISPPSPITLSQSLLQAWNAQWEWKEGTLPFIISFEKISSINPLYKVYFDTFKKHWFSWFPLSWSWLFECFDLILFAGRSSEGL